MPSAGAVNLPGLDYKALIVVGVAGAALIWFINGRVEAVIDAIPGVGEAVNPLDDDNVINQTAESFYQAITGSEDSIGEDIYDAFH